MTPDSKPMRLRLVVTADFRKTEATNWDELRAAYDKSRGAEPGTIPPDVKKGEVVLMLSTLRNQLVFVYPPYEAQFNGTTVKIVASRRLRIEGGRFDPRMLANYAEDVGLRLEGMKRYEEYFAEMQVRARQHRAELRKAREAEEA
jgi:hypothetical protein